MSPPPWLDTEQWPWPPRWLPLADGRLSLVDAGSGPPVVFAHGTPTWSFEWRHALRALEPRHRVIAFDHLGFGLSDRPASADYRPEAHARRFGQAVDQLVPSGALSLVVHDFGGPIGLDWALDHPERLAHLVVVNTWMWPFDDDPLMRRRAAMASGVLGRWMYRRLNASLRLIMPSAYADRRKLTRSIHQQYLSVFPDADSRERVLFALAKALLGSSAFYARLWERRERLQTVPMTIIWGTRDSAFTLPILDRWVRTFPRATVVRLDQAGHWPHEEQPDQFVDALSAAVA